MDQNRTARVAARANICNDVARRRGSLLFKERGAGFMFFSSESGLGIVFLRKAGVNSGLAITRRLRSQLLREAEETSLAVHRAGEHIIAAHNGYSGSDIAPASRGQIGDGLQNIIRCTCRPGEK